MGLLERYGLYVLCLVIFLILGVAIWGSDPQELRNNQDLTTGSNNTAQVKSQDDRRSELDNYYQTQDRDAVAKQRAAEAVFSKAVDPGIGEAKGRQVPELPIEKAEQPSVDTPPQLRVHVIARGDSFSSLAQHYLGDADYFAQIAAANPSLNPRKLKLGAEVKIPPRRSRSGKAKAVPATLPGGTHKVRDGETPWDIAKKYVGTKKATAYSERILELNRISDARRVRAGIVLKLPSR